MAVTIVTIALVAVYGLIISILNANQRNIHNLQAGQYAAEGLEVVRFFRDSNWLQNYSWDGIGNDGASIGFAFGLNGEDSRIIYLKETESAPYWEISGDEEILTNSSGFSFTREITISKVSKSDGSILGSGDLKNAVEVTSKVSWDEHGIEKNVSLSTFLTDWHD